jgi:hypothetical protein
MEEGGKVVEGGGEERPEGRERREREERREARSAILREIGGEERKKRARGDPLRYPSKQEDRLRCSSPESDNKRDGGIDGGTKARVTSIRGPLKEISKIFAIFRN